MLGVSAATLRAFPLEPEENDVTDLPIPGLESTPIDSLTDAQLDSLRMARLQSDFDAVQNAYRKVRIAKTDPST